MSRRFDHWSYAGGNRPTVLPKTFLNFDCFRINDLHIYSLALIGSLVLQLAIFHQSSWSSTFLCRTRISLEKIMTNIIPVPGSVFSHGHKWIKNWDFANEKSSDSPWILKKLRSYPFRLQNYCVVFFNLLNLEGDTHVKCKNKKKVCDWNVA